MARVDKISKFVTAGERNESTTHFFFFTEESIKITNKNPRRTDGIVNRGKVPPHVFSSRGNWTTINYCTFSVDTFVMDAEMNRDMVQI